MPSNAHRDFDHYQRRDTPLAVFMFCLSLLFLALLAGLIYAHNAQVGDHMVADATADDDSLPQVDWESVEMRIQLVGMSLIWPIFIVEAVGAFLMCDRKVGFWRRIGWLLLVCVAPPARLGGRVGDAEIWLPRLGWQLIDKDFRRKLERIFSIPMVIIALMVLPLLAIEYFWRDQITTRPGLRLFLEIANSFIWMAFAVEFIIMISVADKRLRYCAMHWVDLAIILLPIIYLSAQLAPLIRSLRLLRLSQLSRMGRVYRMQGLALKAWRAFLVLEVIQRLLGRSLEKQLKHLEELLAAKEEEVTELKAEIADLKSRIAAEKLRAAGPKTLAGRIDSTPLEQVEIDAAARST